MVLVKTKSSVQKADLQLFWRKAHSDEDPIATDTFVFVWGGIFFLFWGFVLFFLWEYQIPFSTFTSGGLVLEAVLFCMTL